MPMYAATCSFAKTFSDLEARSCRVSYEKPPKSHAGKLDSRREVAFDGKLYVHGCNTARCSISSITVGTDI